MRIEAAFVDTDTGVPIVKAIASDGLAAIDRAYTKLMALFHGPAPRWTHLVTRRVQ